MAQADRALSDYIQAHGREVDARVGEPTAAIALRLLKHREEVLESEKALHREDHEVLEIVTGIPGAHMWHPPTAKQWAQDRRDEVKQLEEKSSNLRRQRDEAIGQLTDRNRQLAVVREWMAIHRAEPVYSAAVAELSTALTWAGAVCVPESEPLTCESLASMTQSLIDAEGKPRTGKVLTIVSLAERVEALERTVKQLIDDTKTVEDRIAPTMATVSDILGQHSERLSVLDKIAGSIFALLEDWLTENGRGL